jgi:hypothetical protein
MLHHYLFRCVPSEMIDAGKRIILPAFELFPSSFAGLPTRVIIRRSPVRRKSHPSQVKFSAAKTAAPGQQFCIQSSSSQPVRQSMYLGIKCRSVCLSINIRPRKSAHVKQKYRLCRALVPKLIVLLIRVSPAKPAPTFKFHFMRADDYIETHDCLMAFMIEQYASHLSFAAPGK